ncbi:MAG: beta-eliminating lyase-related protein [Ferruginibacter sp.]
MTVNRRSFLSNAALALTPAILPGLPAVAGRLSNDIPPPPDQKWVKFFFEGEWFDELGFLAELQIAHKKTPLKTDRYGSGGAVEELEKKMAALTGKEKAIFIPSGTMANQLAIATLSGDNTKIFVQDTSHVYRDEADAAQSVHNKRLMPLAPDKTYFTADELKAAIDGLPDKEVFQSGVGCVSIENPVRRMDERYVPVDEIRKINAYCKANNIKMHMDGARLFMASAWSGTSIKEYASYFDTVYISLYKYLGANAGAVLCGDKAFIDKMPHLIKIYGGSMYSNWTNAAMASHRMDGFEERLQEAIRRSKEIFAGFNKIPGVQAAPLDGGSNMHRLTVPAGMNLPAFREELGKSFIRMPKPDPQGQSLISVNETLLHAEPSVIINALKKAIEKGKQ